MKLTEKILYALAVLALIMKFCLVPGGGVLFVLTMSSISMIYFTFGFIFFNGIRFRQIFKKEAYAETSPWRLVGAVATGLCLSELVIGILYKFQCWPGAGPMMISALVPTLVILIISIVKFATKKTDYYKRILIRGVILEVFTLVLFFTPTVNIIKIQFRNHPSYVQAFIDYNNNPTPELDQKVHLEYMRAVMDAQAFKEYEEGNQK